MIRCRMAPSPTGRLHIGTAHTALFNFLFARHHQGTFILRIDDSDPIRSKKEYEQDIIDSLKWLGINWDEGPDIGGPFAPYRESERKGSYQKYIDQLLNENKAYRCFCSKEELEEKRKQAESKGEMYKYDQKCLNLSSAQIDHNLSEKIPFVVRLKNPNKQLTFVDMVRGEITVDTTPMGDFIISRSDGSALLNFAVVVDDIDFQITHAIRGEDFLNATPYQILIYEALGVTPPKIANLSFIYAPDHTKLSKRHGATGVSEYSELGYLPEALVNFLALLGWNPGDDREIFSMADLIREFDFDKVDKGAPTFNKVKLDWFNSYYIRQKTDPELALLLRPFVKDEKLADLIPQILPLIKDRLVTLADFPKLTQFFVTPPTYPKDLWKDPSLSLSHLTAAVSVLETVTWSKPEIESNLSNLINLNGWKVGDFFMSLRIAICGSRSTPPLTETMLVLGQAESLSRINSAISSLS